MTVKDKPGVTVSHSARITTAEGLLAAVIDEIPVGGGVQMKTVDGKPEETVHPLTSVWHLRLISPDRSVSDQLREADSFDEAVKVGTAYAVKLADRAAQVRADLAV
jgi:hypothetical protein